MISAVDAAAAAADAVLRRFLRVIGRQMRAPQRCLQNVIAGDDLILRKAPPAVHSSDARILAGEILLQPRKPFFCFHFYNTVAEKAVLCQQVKEIAHQHTEGAAGNDVGGIVSGGTLLFPNFCVMLFQYGGQRRKLRQLVSQLQQLWQHVGQQFFRQHQFFRCIVRHHLRGILRGYIHLRQLVSQLFRQPVSQLFQQ